MYLVYNMLFFLYEFVVGKWFFLVVVLVDMFVVLDDFRLLWLMLVDNIVLLKYYLIVMLIFNFDKLIIDNGWNNGYGFFLKEVRCDFMYGLYNYGILDRSKMRVKGFVNVEVVVILVVKVIVVVV